jgi:WhiB family redox-sensing transcriptional regulator
MMQLPVVPEWYGDGLCSQTDPELFFPNKGGNPEPARRICSRCLVRAECLQVAVNDPMLDGIWGGTVPRERRALRERRVA